MLPPKDHAKPCKLCGKPIKVGQQFGILGFDYPDRRHFVCHVVCFDGQAHDTPSDAVRITAVAPVLGPLKSGVRLPAGASEIDISDWR